MIGIYKITSPSGKIYIGQSLDVEKRLKDYKVLNSKKQPRLHRSFLKHGFENHKIEIVCECLIEELNDKERYYQDLFDCIGKNGLNCVLTQSTDRSGKFSEETIAKRTGVKRPDDVRRKISESHKGKKYSKERLLQMSKTSTNPSAETRLKMSLAHLDNMQKEETKIKIAKKLKGRNHTEEARLKISSKHGTRVLNTLTGEIYLSVAKAAKDINHNISWLHHKLKGNTKNNTNLIFANNE
jgi:group I intron endonuclease